MPPARRARAAVPDPPDPREVTLVTGEDHAGERSVSLSLTDVALADCNLANVLARRATLTRVAADTCRLTGAAFPNSTLRDVTITGCRADLTSLEAATLDRVRFEDCVLRDATFLDARLHSVSFVDCDLSGADFSGVQTSRVEMTGCRLDRLRGLPSLRGVQMPWTDVLDNAGLFAAALGIAILEED